MKIRIVKAKYPNYWYADKIGKIYEVAHETEHNYFVKGIGELSPGLLKTDAEEVIEHNSQLYRKVDRPVREGDTIIVTSMDHAEVNEIRTIIEVDEGEMLYTLDSPINGEDLFDYEDDYDKGVVVELIDSTSLEPSAPSYAEVSELIHANFESIMGDVEELAKDDDIVTHNGKQYRKVKRKAAVGELVVSEVDNHGIVEGDVYEIKAIASISGKERFSHGAEFVDSVGGNRCFWDANKYSVLEPIEQSGQSETLTEVDLLANLAQEVAELKRQLTNVATDIVDLEERVDENEKDTEEVIGRINDVSDAVVPVEVIEKVIAELRELEGHAEKLCDHYEDNGIKELAQFHDGKSHAFLDAQKLLKEALRNA